MPTSRSRPTFLGQNADGFIRGCKMRDEAGIQGYFIMPLDIGGILFAFGASIILSVFFITVYWQTAREWNAYFLLKKGGIPCMASVDHAYELVGRSSRIKTYYVRFQLDPHLISGNLKITQQISYETYRILYDGAKLTVRYLPYNPKIARLSELREDLSLRNWRTVAAVIGFIVFPPLILAFLVTYLLDRIWIVYSPR
jgi:hypothetical protein